ncbi:asparagine synthase (glutamine-hydrolyzing) [Kitasatospora purpeofusca]|uniref:asparagine synthase (glutamine-hydrolyzing) n=1 Tax=Kitasatospora purpeofusca TaxID=67352 RepID=UPI0036D3D840
MCGLAGMARLDGADLETSDVQVLHAMSRSLGHRGPDDEETSVRGPVGLAFRRLSLVDPEHGGQPFVSPDGDIVLMANGEVYNHRALEAGLPHDVTMRTDSDCEVLVHLYRRDGLRFLDQVQGMFAVVVWDRVRGKLLFARDRFGIKPLHYTRNRRRISFASETKALFQDPQCPRELDWAGALADPCVNGAAMFSDAPVTNWFGGVEVVPAATIIEIDLRDGATDRHRYWEFPQDPHHDLTAGEFIAEYGRLLAESVEMCATADAELGLLLSGGIDSAMVAALASRTTPIHTFTAVTPGTLANGDAANARRTAAELGLPNHQILMDAAGIPSVEQWRELLWQQESPRCGPEQFYKNELYRAARQMRPALKGMLLGQASDEFNGGYLADFSGGGGWAGAMAGLRQMARQTAAHHRPGLLPFLEPGVDGLLSDSVFGASRPGAEDPYRQYTRLKYRDIQQYNCWHEDRNAAGSGIEARVPFLDHRLVELVLGVPSVLREQLLWDKAILREAARGVLSDRARGTAKVPFFHGSGERQVYRSFCRMLTQDGGALLEESLSQRGAKEFLNRDGVIEAVTALTANPAAVPAETVLRLVNLGLLESMLGDLPAAAIDRPKRVIPPRAEEHDWTGAGLEAMSARMLPDAAVAPGTALALGDDVELLHSHSDPKTWFLVVEGELAFYIEDTVPSDRAWLALLRAVDGHRTLGELLALAAAATGDDVHAEVRATLREALLDGLLVAC